ncbi:hypothetical protein LPJ66_000451 [Kickxella alabastrina]|uniref:Uncharacterized protein n=1 Tax=Kickxella alabastrina TaxID=61397 RepID=A0ACC1IVY4_9FUNG|nr:hypothetical protein LPJ66_000451 [Kickxella alabastrina]
MQLTCSLALLTLCAAALGSPANDGTMSGVWLSRADDNIHMPELIDIGSLIAAAFEANQNKNGAREEVHPAVPPQPTATVKATSQTAQPEKAHITNPVLDKPQPKSVEQKVVAKPAAQQPQQNPVEKKPADKKPAIKAASATPVILKPAVKAASVGPVSQKPAMKATSINPVSQKTTPKKQQINHIEQKSAEQKTHNPEAKPAAPSDDHKQLAAHSAINRDALASSDKKAAPAKHTNGVHAMPVAVSSKHDNDMAREEVDEDQDNDDSNGSEKSIAKSNVVVRKTRTVIAHKLRTTTVADLESQEERSNALRDDILDEDDADADADADAGKSNAHRSSKSAKGLPSSSAKVGQMDDIVENESAGVSMHALGGAMGGYCSSALVAFFVAASYL